MISGVLNEAMMDILGLQSKADVKLSEVSFKDKLFDFLAFNNNFEEGKEEKKLEYLTDMQQYLPLMLVLQNITAPSDAIINNKPIADAGENLSDSLYLSNSDITKQIESLVIEQDGKYISSQTDMAQRDHKAVLNAKPMVFFSEDSESNEKVTNAATEYLLKAESLVYMADKEGERPEQNTYINKEADINKPDGLKSNGFTYNGNFNEMALDLEEKIYYLKHNLKFNQVNDKKLDFAAIDSGKIKEQMPEGILPIKAKDADASFEIGQSVNPKQEDKILRQDPINEVIAKDNNFESIKTQIADKISLVTKFGKNEIVVDLKPENLGRVCIKVSSDKDGISAQVICNNLKTYKEVTNQSATLSQMFKEQGLSLSEIKIHFREGFSDFTGSFDGSGQSHSRQYDQQSNRGGGYKSYTPNNDKALYQHMLFSSSPLNNEGVDYFV